MIQPLDERTPPMTPQLALRVAIVGSIALLMFALIFFRLWFLQVLSGSQYVAEAKVNVTKRIPVAAPRGEILAADGTSLVTSQEVPAIQIEPQGLPTALNLAYIEHSHGYQPAADYAVYNELAKLLNISTRPHSCSYKIYLTGGPVSYNPSLAPIACLVAQGIANSQYANVTVKTDVNVDVQDYIEERISDPDLQGVQPVQVALRKYPYFQLASQVFGYVRPLTSSEANKNGDGIGNFKGATSSDVVGQTGLEYQYNPYLMGTDGYEAVKVNSANEYAGAANGKSPVPGANLKTSLDLKLQQVGQRALQQSLNRNHTATSGAFVAIDPQNGSVYAMGSLPTYHPSTFTHPVSNKTWAGLNSKASNDPLDNRAISADIPNGSTFKPITATAALESGVWSIDQTYDDTGVYKYNLTEGCTFGNVTNGTPNGNCLHNSGDSSSGVINLEEALQVSDDIFFYNLGYLLHSSDALQIWAKQFGIGQLTGIDLPGEVSGEMSSPGLVKALDKQEIECEQGTGIYSYSGPNRQISATPRPGFTKSPKVRKGCGIAGLHGSTQWEPGDNVNAAVGQGYDEVTPIQLAVVYAALANGGSVVTPHIGQDIQTASGTILQRINPGIRRKLDINSSDLDAILTGLHEAAQSPGGTSDDVMGNFPLTVYGKTGTAQIGNAEQIATNTEQDDAWYACFVPSSVTKRPIVVVVSVEDGGFGDVAAAPVAREILSQWFLGKPGKYFVGTAPTTGKNNT